MTKIITKEEAQEMLETPALFEGGAFISINGKPEFFIQTAAERKAELARWEESEQIGAMLKLVELSKKSIKNGEGITAEELLLQRNKARNRRKLT